MKLNVQRNDERCLMESFPCPGPYQSKDGGGSVWLSGLVLIQRHRIISVKGESVADGKSQQHI